MDNIAGKKSGLSWAVNISVALLVMLWVFPTAGLFVSSFRTADQISSNGWWQSLFPTEQNVVLRAADPDDDGVQVLETDSMWSVATLYGEAGKAEIGAWGVTSREIDTYVAGDTR